jgi:hypothetical protein
MASLPERHESQRRWTLRRTGAGAGIRTRRRHRVGQRAKFLRHVQADRRSASGLTLEQGLRIAGGRNRQHDTHMVSLKELLQLLEAQRTEVLYP